MLLDWVIYGLVIWGFATLLNKTVFAGKPASTAAAWVLTVVVFLVNLVVMTALQHFRYQNISQSLGFQLAPKNPLDFVGAFTFSWVFFSLLRRSRKVVSPVGATPEPKSTDLYSSDTANPGTGNEAYAEALAEIEEGRMDKGAWARAFAESAGDESKAKASYIKTRAESARNLPTEAKTTTNVSDAVVAAPNPSAVSDLPSSGRFAPAATDAGTEAAEHDGVRVATGTASPPKVPEWTLFVAMVAAAAVVVTLGYAGFQHHERREAPQALEAASAAARTPTTNRQLDLSEVTPRKDEFGDMPVNTAAANIGAPLAPRSFTYEEATAGVRQQPNSNPPPNQQTVAVQQSGQQRAHGAQVQADLQAVSERAMKDYPYLDTPAGQDDLAKIVKMRDELIQQGVYPSIALTRAVAAFAPAHGPPTERRQLASEAKPADAATNQVGFPPGCRWVTPSEWSCK